MRLALAQINAVVGDLEGNRERILAALADARAESADIVLLPELAVTGYPPEDLLLRPGFVRAAEESLRAIAAETKGLTALVGTPWFDRDLFNACAVCSDGELKALYRKRYLPNYGVFDEERYFASGRELILLRHGEILVGPTICEDIWQPGPPATDLALAGAELLVNLSASPYFVGKAEDREEMLVTRARDNSAYLAFCNLVGGQDELLFDGHSVVLDDEGEVLARAPGFEEALLVVDLDPEAVIARRLRDVRRRALDQERETPPPVSVVHIGSPRDANGSRVGGTIAPMLEPLEQMRLALELGLRDYVEKNGFSEVLLGVSGGIDSTLVATIAADALGGENVVGISNPSRYSSQHSRDDAEELAARLGLDYRVIPIEPMVSAFLDNVKLSGVAEENLQARVRALVWMGLSNQEGHLVLANSNKSELSVGYSTIYGDSVGGFAPIKDVPKTLVWELARWRNAEAVRRGETPPIPESTITKAPSAELRPGQVDQDSLPPYDVLDAILDAYVEGARGRAELVAAGFEEAVVDKVVGLVDRAEWKRRQFAPGPKISSLAFGRDRRLPVTSRWREQDS